MREAHIQIGDFRELKSPWLGYQDSNLGMAIPKTAALPLGDTPTREAG
tara:strand:- start:1010 stop:1153 length:144 start_codon:yes stop_codon:yes gene_type:complete